MKKIAEKPSKAEISTVEIGTVVSSREGPSPTNFEFVVHEDGSVVRRNQFVELDTVEGRLIGRISDVLKANRYFERAESVREYEKKGSGMDSIFPVGRWEFTVAQVKPLGVYTAEMNGSSMLKPSFPPSPGTKVYLANDKLLEKFLGLDPNGIHLGNIEHHDIDVKLNLTRLLQKHLAILAMSGAGKSYLTAVLLEELLERQKEKGRVGTVLIDVHGEYSSLAETIKQDSKYKDYSGKCKIIEGNEIKIGVPNLSGDQLSHFIKLTPIQKRDLTRIFSRFQKTQRKGGGTFNLYDMAKAIEKDENMKRATKESLVNWLLDLDKTRLFADIDNPALKSLVKPGKLSIINLSGITSARKKQIIVSYLLNELFELRRDSLVPPFLVILEEAHQFVPEGTKTEYALAKGIIEIIAREGRKFHASLCLISQRPVRLSTTVLSQCNTHIIMRVTNPNDLAHIEQSSEGITSDTLDSISSLPVGEGLVVGAAVNYPIFVRIRKRKSMESTKGIDLEKAALKFEEGKDSKDKDAEAFM